LPEGRLVLGLPGNPASALVCTRLFLAAIIEKMLTGETRRATTTKRATLTLPMPSNGAREAYVRAVRNDASAEITPILDEDSSLMTVLAQSNALVLRHAGVPAAQTGETVEYLEWIA
jgi:molybdopterin molybdotransferase